MLSNRTVNGGVERHPVVIIGATGIEVESIFSEGRAFYGIGFLKAIKGAETIFVLQCQTIFRINIRLFEGVKLKTQGS